jgi:hypothetical protein
MVSRLCGLVLRNKICAFSAHEMACGIWQGKICEYDHVQVT